MDRKTRVVLVAIIFGCLQPFLWYQVFMLFENPKIEDIAFGLVCIVSTVLCIIGTILFTSHLLDIDLYD